MPGFQAQIDHCSCEDAGCVCVFLWLFFAFFFLRLIQNYFELDSGIYIDTELTLLLFLADMHFNGCSQALSGTDRLVFKIKRERV